jgi:hypothetical protein
MDQKPLVIILADISGYTRFMLETQTSAVHGQLVINGLIEALLEQVDIPSPCRRSRVTPSSCTRRIRAPTRAGARSSRR